MDNHKRGKPSRTAAAWQAMERDEYRCQWCLIVLDKLTPATDAHHIFRPRSLYDEPQYIVSLCHEHHVGDRHSKGTITDPEIIAQVMIPYIWQGEDLTPKTEFRFKVREGTPGSPPIKNAIRYKPDIPPEFIP